LAEAAAEAGIAFAQSTVSNATIAHVAGVPGGRHWFQLYCYGPDSVWETLVDTAQAIARTQETLTTASDQQTRSTIKSPITGIVKNMRYHTIGGVVRPGEEILQIIPLDEELFLEARVKPEDIANVKLGQAATIKLSAYDYTIYGSLKGAVSFVSADTFKDERAKDGDPHYRVTLSVDLSQLTDRQRNLEIRPGMQAAVELHTGSKTVLHYLLKPLYKSREAMREK